MTRSKQAVGPSAKTARQFFYPGSIAVVGASEDQSKMGGRIFRMLLRAGFSPTTIYKVLKKWNVEDELLNVLEGETPQIPEDASS